MRHKKLKKRLKSAPITVTHKDLEAYQLQATERATQIVNLFPLLVLRDKFGFGKVRLERFLDHFNETVDSFNKGYLDLEDVHQMLKEEVKIDIRG